jgi:hypothetical protein
MKAAVFWIRDGVLVDRMPVNAVAFGVASLMFANGDEGKTDLATLINFAFETSGISCADKMRRFNELQSLIADVESAAQYYNQLASNAGSRCAYFAGACDLVKQLHGDGVMNFITSAVDQPVLDSWSTSEQGQLVAPYLTEILGKRADNFNKGRDHFAYVREKYGVDKIVYVADALAEISTAAKFANEFNIVPIGFAAPITTAAIREAHRIVLVEHAKLTPPRTCVLTKFALDESKLELPDSATLVKAMREHTSLVVESAPDGIMENIRVHVCRELERRGI